MNDHTDSQLLRAYAEHRSERAFTELVRRHVDFVYSAALRMVCDSHLAEDVAQSAFVALAKNAAQLTDRPVLSGWLHRTAQNIAAQTVRTEVRRRAREQEAAAMNELLATESDVLWEHIAPHLDAGLGELSEGDRDALLLRYFERKSAREMAQTLGISEDAAQKRVNRSVERLREVFAKHGVTVGASGLVLVISAHAVQAAPLGLAITISTAAAFAGTTIATTATATATKAIAMTTLQNTIVTATIIVLAGAGIYEARQASRLRDQVQTLQQKQAPLNQQILTLTREQEGTKRRLTVLLDEQERAQSERTELLRLRGLTASLRRQLEVATNSALTKAETPVPHTPWKLREPRRIGEFQNVGRGTAEAAAETVLWAAQNRPSDLVDMVYLSPETIKDYQEKGRMDTLIGLLSGNTRSVLTVGLGPSQQVWLDGGKIISSVTVGDGKKEMTYAGVMNFRVCGRQNMDDPQTERHSDMYLTKTDSQWKLVLTGLSPAIPKE